jgi:alkanesulfonate monooxygenase SsuD/methylene tetrahydromethanopterin reductase-like flavin-dependent oxidoreductase (luciferase family)
VKFGLMYEIQIREPHYEGIEHERYKQVMAQAELADQVGFDHFWTVEHHFLREFFTLPGAGSPLRSDLAAHQADPYRARGSTFAGSV